MEVTQVKPRLGDLLLSAKAITAEQLDRALKEQTSWGGRLGQNLLALGFLDEVRLASAVASQLGLPSIDLDRAQLAEDATRLLPLELVERYGVMPLAARRREGKLLVATFDPTDRNAMLAVRQVSGLIPVVHVATASAIERAVRRHYYGEATPTPPPVDPRFTVTRNTIDPAQLLAERDVVDRVDELEKKIDRLTRLVESLLDAVPRRR